MKRAGTHALILFDHGGAIIDNYLMVQLDSSVIKFNSPHNNGILSRYTTVESNLTSVTCLCHSEYKTVSFM